MSYVKCINNQPYIQPPGHPPQTKPLFGLTIGKVYKVIADRTAENRGLIRVIDESFGESGSEDGYLYPADYFEPFTLNGRSQGIAPVTFYLNEYLKGVLHAEAVAADKPVSALVREWVEEHLDLPA